MRTNQETKRTRNPQVGGAQATASRRSDATGQAPPREASDEQIRERVEARAYERYLARGAEDGHDLDDWLEAEREIRGQREEE